MHFTTHLVPLYPENNMRICDFHRPYHETLSVHEKKESIISKNPRNFSSAWPESFKADLRGCSRHAEVKPWGWTWNSRGPPETRRTPSRHLAAFLISQRCVLLTYILVWKSPWSSFIFRSNSRKSLCPTSLGCVISLPHLNRWNLDRARWMAHRNRKQ